MPAAQAGGWVVYTGWIPGRGAVAPIVDKHESREDSVCTWHCQSGLVSILHIKLKMGYGHTLVTPRGMLVKIHASQWGRRVHFSVVIGQVCIVSGIVFQTFEPWFRVMLVGPWASDQLVDCVEIVWRSSSAADRVPIAVGSSHTYDIVVRLHVPSTGADLMVCSECYSKE